MSSVSELISYANEIATKMGLHKSLDIEVDSRFGFNYYSNTKEFHRIRLTDFNKSELLHELGHAYMSEKLTKLYRIFEKVMKALNILAARYGEVGDFVSNVIYSIILFLYFLFGIFIAFENSSPAILLPLMIFGIILIIPVIDELLATYFGNKFKAQKRK
ncbi:MAG: hypothetical protein NWF08_08550 [Candidatus Bathyarchaeota archaeon]|nr:hypothetical protein [Candidatus Bathyarchaeota archaeon]